jgi:hypothetical protein
MKSWLVLIVVLLRDWGKSRNYLVRVSGLWTKIQIQYLNYLFDRDVQKMTESKEVRETYEMLEKVAPEQVSSEYFCFPCQIHSTNSLKKSSSSSSINHRGYVQ